MSDRKLDAWIAENIFGGGYTTRFPDLPIGDGRKIPRFYTSDMNEAVEVLESLREVHLGTVHPNRWACYHTDSYDASWTIDDSISSTPAMAICLAAYRLETGEGWDER